MRHVELLVLGLAAGCASAGSYRDMQLPEAGAVAAAVAAPAPVFTGGDLQSVIASMPVAAAVPGAALEPQAKGETGGDGLEPHQRFQPPYREDRMIGENAQPEWTLNRRFATTDVYVLAPGQIVLEQWARVRTPRGEGPQWFFQSGVNIGIENRLQFNAYENWKHHANDATEHDAVELEAKYAFGRWDRYPGNPAIGVEYRFEDDQADYLGGKLLLADDFRAYGWRWALNGFFGGQLSDANRAEIGASGGISYMLIDSKLSIGLETRYRYVSIEHERSDGEYEWLLGPNMQWRPTENMFFDLVPLFGVSHSDRDEPRMEIMFVFGIDIGATRRDTIRADGSTIK
jgi:hypothetical protein